jgi:hypothetical protein
MDRTTETSSCTFATNAFAAAICSCDLCAAPGPEGTETDAEDNPIDVNNADEDPDDDVDDVGHVLVV